MCAESFENWFRAVLPRLEENAVIVIDNAPYHSRKKERIPATNWNIPKIKEWLQSKHITYEDGMLKKEFLCTVEQHKSAYMSYVKDKMAKSANKTVLRIPPYHCELNAIELVWAQIKGYVAARNKTFTIREVKELLEEAVTKVSPNDWDKCVRHVIQKVENEMWKLDNIREECEERLAIDLNEDSVSSSE
ncbi:uncharacterized protein LOC111873159 [Cryptotermes secundus]|uniref:uncharacterized protein LOC111873159 n=1 Tax=Cryptotermes secundus TaxID=105785 RepID=UPI000CD7CF2B|nr:uncharacterized protein LOC111873159 [Cryptotermes secundus]